MRRKDNQALAEVLVQWEHEDEASTTWEDYWELQHRFPEINLEDKVTASGRQLSQLQSEDIEANRTTASLR